MNSLTYAGLGYVFSHNLNRAGSLFIALALLALTFYAIHKLFRRSLRIRVFERHQLIRLNLEIPCVSPAESSKD